jgi:hypothetical protein
VILFADTSALIKLYVEEAGSVVMAERVRQARMARGADAVHLASALALRDAGLDLTFAVADGRLLEAAVAEGLEAFDPEAGSG